MAPSSGFDIWGKLDTGCALKSHTQSSSTMKTTDTDLSLSYPYLESDSSWRSSSRSDISEDRFLSRQQQNLNHQGVSLMMGQQQPIVGTPVMYSNNSSNWSRLMNSPPMATGLCYLPRSYPGSCASPLMEKSQHLHYYGSGGGGGGSLDFSSNGGVGAYNRLRFLPKMPSKRNARAPRMRWTTSLHARFVHAVELLGGHESILPLKLFEHSVFCDYSNMDSLN